MRLYIFKSEVKAELHAFAADPGGEKLPRQYRPWHAIGVVSDGGNPPHGLSRQTIEDAIGARGFQLWRMKESAKPSNAAKGP